MKKIKGKTLNQASAVKKSSSKTSKSKSQESPAEKNTSSKLQSKRAASRSQQSETEIVSDITSRKGLEMALQESEEAFRTLAETMPQIVWATRADGWNIFFNEQWVKYTGLTLKDSYGHGWNIPFHPDDKKRSWDAWQQATKHGATYSLEVRLRRADGVYRWWLVRGAPLLDTTGKIVKWVGTCTDIDDLKQAERRQTLSTEILAILNNPPSMDDAISNIITTLKRETGFDAIGIRLQRGDDFPYIAQDGFSKDFILAENTLAVRTQDGGVCVDKDGNVCLECTCGVVISGKTDPTNPIFTPSGSCWTNESCARTDHPIEDKRLHPRDRCVHEGYHSVALIPLRADKRIIGILQLNDHRPNQFTLEMISFLENMGALIGIAVARKRAEDEMHKAKERADALNLELEAANKALEERVATRTADLSRTNEQLRQEVGERRRAEDRLLESEMRMERAQEIAHLGSWELDLVSNHLSWSDEVYRIFGLQPREFGATYEAFLDRVHPDDRTAVDSAYSGSLREGRDSYEIEHRVVRKSDEEVRIVHEKCEHFRNESGAIIRSIGMVHDITERKQAEDALRESEARLRRFYESGLIGVIYWDINGTIIDANDKFLEMVGYTRHDLNAGRIDWVKMTPPEYRYLDEQSVAELKTIGVNKKPFEKEYIRKDGTRISIIVAGAMLDDARVNGVALVLDISERKKAEEVQGRLAAIIESAEDAIIGEDLNGIIQSWNVGAENIFGYAAEEIIGKHVSILAPPGCVDEVQDILALIKDGERITNLETGRIRKDGTIIPVSLTVSAIKNASGRIIGASKIAHDITERKQAEEALRSSEEQFRALAESIPNLAWWANGDGFITWYNRRWYEYTGTTPEQMEGWGWQSVHDPKALPKVLERWKASIATGEPFDMEFPLLGADGIFRSFLTRVLPLKDSTGRVIRWFGTNTDISAMKQAEDDLRKSEELYRSLFDNMLNGFAYCRMIFDENRPQDFIYLAVNDTFTALTGLKDVVGKKVTEVIPGIREADPKLFELYSRVALSGRPERAEIYVEALKAWYSISVYSPEKEFFVAVFDVITERKRVEEEIKKLNDDLFARNDQLEFANKELESFIYSVSHDLRAPLRHISGFSDLLKKNIADKLDEKGHRYFSIIQDGSEKMSRLIDDLLNLSRISRQEISRTEVDMSVIAGSIMKDLREAQPNRSVEVDIKKGLTAFADRGLIEVALSNLLGNSWKFTAKTEHARIEFGSVEHEGKIFYFVTDNGVGFDQKYAGKMFWPFHRLHSEAAFEGTGIGLAIVDRIIRCHGGKIWAEGIEGKGAKICFSLA